MKPLFYKFWTNIVDIFKKYWAYHLLAVVSTYIIVVTNLDWIYFEFWKESTLYYISFSAAAVGGLFPILVPIVSLIYARVRKNISLINTSFALGQSVILGAFISSFYKMFTGRAHPDLINALTNSDITHIFKFGILRGGIFWGWPSSHTAIAFAMAVTLFILYSKNKTIKTLAIIYAFYIGIGVSMTIHWFSDFLAGAIIGTIIGIVVGKAFKERTPQTAL